MDRGAWRAPIHEVTESDMTETERTLGYSYKQILPSTKVLKELHKYKAGLQMPEGKKNDKVPPHSLALTVPLILLPSPSIYCISDPDVNSYGINQFTGRAGLQSDKDCRPDYKPMCCFLLKEAFKKTVYFVIYLIHILIEV